MEQIFKCQKNEYGWPERISEGFFNGVIVPILSVAEGKKLPVLDSNAQEQHNPRQEDLIQLEERKKGCDSSLANHKLNKRLSYFEGTC